MKPCEKQLNIRQTLCDKIDGQYKGQLRAYFPKRKLKFFYDG